MEHHMGQGIGNMGNSKGKDNGRSFDSLTPCPTNVVHGAPDVRVLRMTRLWEMES